MEVVRVLTTGIPTCDQLREIAFSGNVIPQNWYRVFVKSDLKHPKPHLLAINILADIVYWYRPREIRDESSGQIIGYQKKFRDDLLQRSYTQIAEQFGCSSGQAKDAIVFLEEMGVVRREFRTLRSNGMVYANVLYLALDVERLKALTYPCGEISPDGCPEKSGGASDEISDTPVPEFRGGCGEISTDSCGKFPRTNTEITAKTSTEISTENSIHPSSRARADFSTPTDGLTDEQRTEQMISELFAEQGIPESYLRNPEKLKTAVQYLCEFDYYQSVPIEKTEIRNAERWDNYILLINSLIAMLTQCGTQVYCNEETNARGVLKALNAAADGFNCGALSEMLFEALDDFSEALNETHIKNYTGYAKAVLWNVLNAHRIRQNVKYAII